MATEDVLRLVKAGEPPMIFYARGTAREHATVQYGAQASAVRRFLRAREKRCGLANGGPES